MLARYWRREVDLGVDLKHLVIGHLTDITPGSEPLGQTSKAIAKRGAFLGFDTVGHQMVASANPEAGKVKYVLEILNAGYEDNLMLAADFSQSPQLKANWGNGFSTVLVQFVPKLRYAGVSDATLHKILVDNPRRFLSRIASSRTEGSTTRRPRRRGIDQPRAHQPTEDRSSTSPRRTATTCPRGLLL